MGRMSVKEDKNIYQRCREELGLSRDAAAEKLELISADRIERIESGRAAPMPEDILCMAKGYNNPALINHFCTHECPIGQKYIPEIEQKSLAESILEILNTLLTLDKEKNRLIEIAADGSISETEREDFEKIRRDLEQMSATVASLRIWTETELNGN